MKPCRCCWLVAFSISWVSIAWSADTVQDFTSTFPDPNLGLERLSSASGGLGTPPVIVAGWAGNAVQITHDGQGGQNNWVAWDERIEGGFTSLNLNFEVRFEGTGVSGEGLGFGLLNTAEFGQRPSSGLSWQPDEPNLAQSIGIGFDLFNNVDIDPDVVTNLKDSVSFHYDGQVVQQVLTANLLDTDGNAMPDNWLELGQPIAVDVNIQTLAGGGADVSVTMIDLVSSRAVPAFANVNLPTYSPSEARLAFGARTIGIDSSMQVDNVNYVRNQNSVLIDDFESFSVGDDIPPLPPSDPIPVGGTPFVLQRTEGEPGPTIASDGEGPGVHPARLQLTQEVPGTRNYVMFDKTSDDASRIDADFDFRIKNVTNLSADGMAFVLADTAAYGDEGEFIDGGRPWFEAEEPNLLNGLGIGFDTYDNNEEGEFDPAGCGFEGTCDDARANHVSLHWDNEKIGDIILIPSSEMDLVGDQWHHARVLVDQTDAGMIVSMTLRDGVDGDVLQVLDNVLIPGAKFDGSARAAFGGRTGDAFDIHEIDNLLIRFGAPSVVGDFDGSGALDMADIDDLTQQSAGGLNPPEYDLDGDTLVNDADVSHWIKDLFNSWIGDANLNGEFNSGDLIDVLAAGVYEDEVAGNAMWSTGDWNGDGEFTSSDLITALADGGYEQGPRAAAQAVPEPATIVAALLAVLGMLPQRRR